MSNPRNLKWLKKRKTYKEISELVGLSVSTLQNRFREYDLIKGRKTKNK
jgi:DNA-binding Lrp family transcriptional regulator